MAASRNDKVSVACPHCGHVLAVPPTAISTVCKKCSGHFKVQDVLNPKPSKTVQAVERRSFDCFNCGTALDAPISAESTMCKRCSTHIDLRDYNINSAVSKNFRTKGAFVVDSKGYVFNTEAHVGEAVIKGRFLGKLNAERTLTIYSTAEIKGTITAGCLVIPAQNRYFSDKPLAVGSAEISGELTADLIAEKTVTLKSSAVMFGNTEARNIIVEPGAVVVGEMRIGVVPPTEFTSTLLAASTPQALQDEKKLLAAPAEPKSSPRTRPAAEKSKAVAAQSEIFPAEKETAPPTKKTTRRAPAKTKPKSVAGSDV
ncbi:MAG TPA: polymer-forming cytoskeletal protein [Verrucomicrobiae bacterium]